MSRFHVNRVIWQKAFSAVVFFACVACVSKQTASSVSTGLDNNQEKRPAEEQRPVRVSYERRSALDERLNYLQANRPRNDDKGVSAPVVEGRPLSEPTKSSARSPELDSLVMFVQSERWNDVLAESERRWKVCLEDKVTTEACRTTGRARAVALARLGYLRDALSLYDVLSDGELSSRDALVFAGLLAESGSLRLCAQLARSGLQWEPVELRPELYSILTQCLRRDGQAELARSTLSRALAEYPEHPVLLLESSLLFVSEGNLTQGCDLLERLYLQEFNDIAVFYNWGQCVVKRRDPEAAKIVLQRARRLWPSERLWVLLAGEIAFLEGDSVRARRDGLDYLSGADASDVFKPQAERLVRYAQGE